VAPAVRITASEGAGEKGEEYDPNAHAYSPV
jgi:hypothetical protein